jgi:hypothetical protein
MCFSPLAMKPDSRMHNRGSEYVRYLVDSLDMTQVDIASQIGICRRSLQCWLYGERTIPYPVQYCLEMLVNSCPEGSDVRKEYKENLILF